MVHSLRVLFGFGAMIDWVWIVLTWMETIYTVVNNFFEATIYVLFLLYC